MKKKLWIMGILACGIACCAFTACNKSNGKNDGDDVPKYTVSVQETATVVEYETVTLSADTTGEGASVTWSSSDVSVATVDENGVVYGVQAGTATITAKVTNDVSASCTVTVTETPYLHTIELSETDVRMYKTDGESEVEASVWFNGEELTGYDVSYTWTHVNDAESYVSVDTANSGATATFHSVAVGEAEYTVSATVRGKYVEATVSITVMKDGVTYAFANDSFVLGANGYDVSLTLGSDETKNLTIGAVNGSINGVPSGEITGIVWESSNSAVATVESGVIKGLAAGSAVLTGTTTYHEEEVTITVNVTVAKAEHTVEQKLNAISTYAADGSLNPLSLPAEVNGSVIVSIKVGANTVYAPETPAAQSTSVEVNLPVRAIELGKDKAVVIETDEAIYTYMADVYTFIIGSASDLDKWQEIASRNAVRGGLCMEEQLGALMHGYFALSGNIEYNKVFTAYKTYNALWNICSADGSIGKTVKDNQNAFICDWGSSTIGFHGVFDGQGYSINGLTVNGNLNGFITTMGAAGVVKNVSFLHASVKNASLIACAGAGTFENIYVQYDALQSGTDGKSSTFHSSGSSVRTLTNVIIDLSSNTFSDTVENMNIIINNAGEGKLDGVYVISEVAESASVKYYTNVAAGSSVNHFSSFAALFADENASAKVAAFGDFWAVESGKYVIAQGAVPALAPNSIAFSGVSESCHKGDEITLNASSAYVTYSLKTEVTGVSISGNKVTVGSDATEGQSFTVVVTSVFNSAVSTEITITIQRELNKYTLENTTNINFDLAADGTIITSTSIDISDVLSNLQGVTTVEVKFGSTQLYSGAIGATITVALNGNVAGTVSGEQNFVLTCSSASADYEVTIPVYITTKTFNSTNTTTAAAFSDVLNAAPAGIYELGSDLDFNDSPLKKIAEFKGVLDGKGYAIKNTKLTHMGDTDGYYVHFIYSNKGTIKNLAVEITDIGWSAGNRKVGFVYDNAGGTISNVYMDVTLNSSWTLAPEGTGGATFTNNRCVGILAQRNLGGLMENCIVNVHLGTGVTINHPIGAVAALTQWSNVAAVVKNCYVISDNDNVKVVQDTSICGIDASNKKYATLQALLAEVTFNAENGWSNYWTEEDNRVLKFNDASIGVVVSSANVPSTTALKTLLTTHSAAYFELTEDINFNGDYLRKIAEFKGHLDGKGHAITNCEIKYVGDDSGNYYTHFIETNKGTIENLYVQLNGIQMSGGNGHRAFIFENMGIVRNVYLNVNLTESRTWASTGGSSNPATSTAAQIAGSYTARTGLLTGRNINGYIDNCIVNVTADAGTTFGTFDVWAVTTCNQYGTRAPRVSHCYAITNGIANINGVCSVADNNATAPYGTATMANSFSDLNSEAFAIADGWSKYWTVSSGTISFGSNVIYTPAS